MKTVAISQITAADLPFVCSRGNGDGTVTLYYIGDDVPKLPTVPLEMVAVREAKEAKDAADAQTAKQHAKLAALAAMSPAQVQTWVQANVTNLAQAQDAIATLAVAVSVLARQL